MPLYKNSKIQTSVIAPKLTSTEQTANLLLKAFKSSVQANIIFEVKSGEIIMVNKAAANLLGYSQKELLSLNKAGIFDMSENSFKKLLKVTKDAGQGIAHVTVLKKNGKKIPCEITSAHFTGEAGVEKSIVTIRDRSKTIQEQTNIDAENEKVVKENIIAAKKKQKGIDAHKEKVVIDNIAIAKSKQKTLDAVNDKEVADNISIAKRKQKGIDLKKEKIVADNILLAQEKSDKRISENYKLIRSLGEVSYDVMWDWNIKTDKIYVGGSVEEVFGYRLNNNTINFKGFIACLIPEEKNKVEKRIQKSLFTNGRSWSDTFMFRRQDGSTVATMSRANIVRDKNGKAIHLVGAIQVVRKVRELEGNLADQHIMHGGNRGRFIEVAKLSFDIIWDWNIETGEVFRGEGFEKLLGFPLQVYKGDISDWNDHIHPDDREAVEKKIHDSIVSPVLNFEYAFRFIRANGSVANVFNRATIIRDDRGNALRMIGVLHDLTRLKELEDKLEKEILTREKIIAEHADNFKLIFNSATDVLYDIDLKTKTVMVSDAFKKQYGYLIPDNMETIDNWLNHIFPDDKKAVIKDFKKAIQAEDVEWKYSYRFLRADNSVANVSSTAIILRHLSGKAYRMFGSMHDNREQQVLEEKLKQEIKLKEKQIKDAVADAKDTERADIGKELHDNINQLLGASKLYIDMAKKGGKDSKNYLSQSSKYTLEAIEEIRKLTKGLTTDTIKNLGLREAIEDIAEQTMEVNPVKIICSLKTFNEKSVPDKFKLNMYRIVQEQLNNILKHAKATVVKISLLQNEEKIVLSILDNGVGFDISQKREGIGVANIKSRANTYNGNAGFISEPGKGCMLEVKFPVPKV